MENQPYDVVRQALKEVELDSSRRVELEDFVDVKLHPLQSFSLSFSEPQSEGTVRWLELWTNG
jgi:hypothetical protein